MIENKRKTEWESRRRIQLASFLSNDHVHVLFQLCFKFNFGWNIKKYNIVIICIGENIFKLKIYKIFNIFLCSMFSIYFDY